MALKHSWNVVNAEDTLLCDFCENRAEEVGYYGERAHAPQMWVCHCHTLPLTHAANPHASLVETDPYLPCWPLV